MLLKSTERRNSLRWLKTLPQQTHSYNSSFHRIIRSMPDQAWDKALQIRNSGPTSTFPKSSRSKWNANDTHSSQPHPPWYHNHHSSWKVITRVFILITYITSDSVLVQYKLCVVSNMIALQHVHMTHSHSFPPIWCTYNVVYIADFLVNCIWTTEFSFQWLPRYGVVGLTPCHLHWTLFLWISCHTRFSYFLVSVWDFCGLGHMPCTVCT